MKIRYGVMILGPAYCGKSSLINTLSQTIEKLKKTDILTIKKITLNPRSITLHELYGYMDETDK